MNPNILLKQVKQELGIGTFIATQFSDYDLFEKICSGARKDFSRIYGSDLYIPNIKFNSDNAFRARFLTYKLPKVLMDELAFEESFIADVRTLRPAPTVAPGNDPMVYMPSTGEMTYPIGGSVGHSGFLGNYASSHAPTYMGQPIASQLSVMQTITSMDLWRKPLKAKFKSPNMIEFNPRGIFPENLTFELSLKICHPKSLYTVDEAHAFIVKRLAVYDIQELLWNAELKGLDGLSNGYDNISLKIDDWAQATERKIEYIKELERDIVLLENIHSY